MKSALLAILAVMSLSLVLAKAPKEDPMGINLYFSELTEEQKEYVGDKWDLRAAMMPHDTLLWKKYIDRASKKPYWYNIVTKYSTWDPQPEHKLARDFNLRKDTPAAFRSPPPPVKTTPKTYNYCKPYICMNNSKCSGGKCQCTSDWEGELCHIPSKIRTQRMFKEMQDSPITILKINVARKKQAQQLKDIDRMRDLVQRTLPTLGSNLLPVTNADGGAFPSSFGETSDSLPGPRDNLHQLSRDNAWEGTQAMYSNGVGRSQYSKFELYPSKGKNVDPSTGLLYDNEYAKRPAQFDELLKVADQAEDKHVAFSKVEKLFVQAMNEADKPIPQPVVKENKGRLLNLNVNGRDFVAGQIIRGTNIADFGKDTGGKSAQIQRRMELTKESILKSSEQSARS